MNKILCSTGAIIGRPNGRNVKLLSDCIEQIHCDAYEFMMYDTWYETASSVANYLISLPTEFPVYHCEKSIGELISNNELQQAFDKFKLNCKKAAAIGSKILVLHLWNGLISDANIELNYNSLFYLLEIADTYHLILTIENVVCNNQDPMTHLLCLKNKYPEISFTFDTKMAEFHNQLSDLYTSDIFSNIKHLHINDYKGGYKDWKNLRTLNIGDGQIDFNLFFNYIQSQNYNGDYTVEATAFDRNGMIHFKELNACLKKLQELKS